MSKAGVQICPPHPVGPPKTPDDMPEKEGEEEEGIDLPGFDDVPLPYGCYLEISGTKGSRRFSCKGRCEKASHSCQVRIFLVGPPEEGIFPSVLGCACSFKRTLGKL